MRACSACVLLAAVAVCVVLGQPNIPDARQNMPNIKQPKEGEDEAAGAGNLASDINNVINSVPEAPVEVPKIEEDEDITTESRDIRVTNLDKKEKKKKKSKKGKKGTKKKANGGIPNGKRVSGMMDENGNFQESGTGGAGMPPGMPDVAAIERRINKQIEDMQRHVDKVQKAMEEKFRDIGAGVRESIEHKKAEAAAEAAQRKEGAKAEGKAAAEAEVKEDL